MAAMFNHRVRLVLNGVAIAAMLFAHAVSAAQACTAASDTPQMAFNNMDCAEMASQNVCLQQYLAGDQNSGTTQILVAALPDLVVLTVPLAPAEHRMAPSRSGECTQGSSDPPSSIRFCSFQL